MATPVPLSRQVTFPGPNLYVGLTHTFEADWEESVSIAEENRVTIDHGTIRRWVEERDGFPATVAGTHSGDDVGVLRIGFGEED